MVASPTFIYDDVYHMSTHTMYQAPHFSHNFIQPYTCGRGRRPGDEARIYLP